MHRRLFLLAVVASSACHWLEDPIEVKPIASLSAFEGADDLSIKPGEARVLSVQALDREGKPINGASIVFVRDEPRAFDFETTEPTSSTLFVTTANQSVFGLEADGLALARIRIAEDAGAKEGDIYGFATTSADAAAAGLVVRFHVRAVEDAVSDAGDAGGRGAGVEGRRCRRRRFLPRRPGLASHRHLRANGADREVQVGLLGRADRQRHERRLVLAARVP